MAYRSNVKRKDVENGEILLAAMEAEKKQGHPLNPSGYICWWCIDDPEEKEDLFVYLGHCFASFRGSLAKHSLESKVYLALLSSFRKASLEESELFEDEKAWYNFHLGNHPLSFVCPNESVDKPCWVEVDLSKDVYEVHYWMASVRMAVEYNDNVKAFYEMVKRGVPERLAYLMCLYLRKEGGLVYFSGGWPGHSAWSAPTTNGACKNFMDGVYKKKGALYRDESYMGTGGMFHPRGDTTHLQSAGKGRLTNMFKLPCFKTSEGGSNFGIKSYYLDEEGLDQLAELAIKDPHEIIGG